MNLLSQLFNIIGIGHTNGLLVERHDFILVYATDIVPREKYYVKWSIFVKYVKRTDMSMIIM